MPSKLLQPASEGNSANDPTLYFDGVCNLCHHAVGWIIRRDRLGIIRYQTLQSEEGQALLHKLPAADRKGDTVLLLFRGRIYTHSSASLQSMILLGGTWAILGRACLLVPAGLRDSLYHWIAANRYRWFGQRETCTLPVRPEGRGKRPQP